MGELTRFGGQGDTSVTALAILATLLAIGLIFVLPRKYIVVPFLFSTLLIPMGQKVVVGGINLMMFRIVIIFTVCRLFFLKSDDKWKFRTTSLDWVVIAWCIVSTLAFTLLWGEWAAFVNRMGVLLDVCGVYFTMRILLRDEEDLDRVIRVFAVICIILAASMMLEQTNGRNLFSILGGVPDFSAMREGKYRAQGPFAHSILAGTFGAVLLPLFFGLWWKDGKSKLLAWTAMVAAITVSIVCWSSTPLMALGAGIVGLLLWPVRRWMRPIRWGIAFTLIGLHLVMKAPVWALIARVSIVGGSSADHRYELVNNFIRYYYTWWLLGIRYTGSWGWDMFDTANAYVDSGVTGGIFTLALFVTMMVHGFKLAGRARKATEVTNPAAARRAWTLGACLFANLVGFFGIIYFDQTNVMWNTLLAMFSTAYLTAVTVPEAVAQPTFSFAKASSKFRTAEEPAGAFANQGASRKVTSRL